jgi:hypothetical protein
MGKIKKIYDDYDIIPDPEEKKYIEDRFKRTFEVYTQSNYPEEDDSLMCSIHSHFDNEGHNCIGCNLESGSLLLCDFLSDSGRLKTSEQAFTAYIWYLYLLVSKMEEYLDIMNLTTKVKSKKFGVFSKIKRWANFIKHPKAFMFVHHPTMVFEGSPDECNFLSVNKSLIIIDDNFVKEHYSNGNNNTKLYKLVGNKEGVLVKYPDPLELMQEFIVSQKEFVQLICKNEIIREELDERATIYYEQEDKKSI